MHINYLAIDSADADRLHHQRWTRRLGRNLGLVDRKGEPDRAAIVLAMVTGVTVSISLFVLAISFYFYFIEDNPPADIQRITFVQDTAVSGDQVRLAVDLCRYTDAPLSLSLAWVDGLRYIAPTLSPPGLTPGCYEDIPLVLDVPNLPPGDYALEFQFTYAVNFMRTRSVNYLTGYVTVLEDRP